MPRTTATSTRSWRTAFGLPTQARLRREHAGRWVAWSEDFSSVGVVSDDPMTVRTAACQAGAARAALEWVPSVLVRPIDSGA